MAKLVVPQTVAEMQEIMNTPAKAAEWIQSGQLSEVVDAYNEATRPKLADQVADQLQAFFNGNNVVENKVSDALNKVLAERGVPARPQLGVPENFGQGARSAAAANPNAPGKPMDDLGWANIGDFARTVFNKGRVNDDRYSKALEVMNAYSSVDPSTGGFLIPETMRSEIYDLVLENSVVRPRASVITMTSGVQLLPYVDQTTHVGSVFGGMSFSRVKESGTVTPTEAKFGRVRLDPTKMMGTARVPNELWADAPALSTWLMAALPRGIAFFEDIDFLTGDGASEPLGVQNSGAAITVSAETGQGASTIVVENVLNIYARCLPQSLGSAVWLANPTCFPQLMQLSIAVGTGGAPVMLVNAAAGAPMTLLGRPLILTEKVPALGSAGCLGLYDFGFYLIGDRQALSVESSEHSRFSNDETELKAIVRNDGRPWIQSAITPVNGSTLSPFVLLGAVA
ncbi:MAG: phage major capsid protein [Dehalococcoidia bacterium]